MNFFRPWSLALALLLLTGFLLSLPSGKLLAEGTADLRSAGGDPVMLFVGHPNFGQFASYNGPEESRLNFRIAQAGETVYFGMSRSYRSSGLPESFGQYQYRVRSAADDSVVFGPIVVNADRENLSTYEQAALGPEELVPGGYPTDARSSFVAPAAGEYYVEFSQLNSSRPRYIGLWDITIANTGRIQTGRVYSRNWAFRVPELTPSLPECAFGAELSTRFYSYTSDGFVSMIDFTDSGFQPLSFTLAFNRTGPGTSGDLLLDRQSVPEANATANVAEHLIFLEEPDATLFPDGQCGAVSTASTLNCQANETFCIPVTVTLRGQVQIILDFDNNGVYDEETDRLLAYSFDDPDNLEACVPWDGLLPDGTRSEEGSTVDIIVEYTQGVQHWALYDGELMRNGFCVTPVRPLCDGAGPTPLYYDDLNIPDDPGNGAPKRVLEGCECQTAQCRTWTNFNAYATEDCSVQNDNTTGYGDRNTLNTWWFASSRTTVSFDVPLESTSLSGADKHCPGQGVDVTLSYQSTNAIGTIRWTGPDGALPAFNDQREVVITQSGDYTATVVDEFGCESEADYMLMDVMCSLSVNVLNVTCSDNGTDTDATDDTYTAVIRVDGNNSDGFTANGQTYAYGEAITIGPLPISGGDLTFSAVDSEFSCCAETVTIPAPLPCSTGCAITSGVVLRTACIDPNTPTDPSDDMFTFDMIIEGQFLSPGWITEEGLTGAYDTELTFGPYLISNGPVSLRFRDQNDPECMMNSIVQPPTSCSDVCVLEPTVTNLVCDNRGTPFDVSDDTYTFDLAVSAVNAPTPGFSINGSGVHFYGQPVAVGPVAMSGADYTFTVADISGNGCALTFTLDERPTGCEVACGINIAESRVVCDDGGTTSRTDDTYGVEIMVTNPNPAVSSWTHGGATYSEWGTFVRVANISPGASDMVITVRESGSEDCGSTVTVTAPELTVTCPDDVSSYDFPVVTQSFGGELTLTDESVPTTEAICWMDRETTRGQRRYADRITLARRDEDIRGTELFSFYLFASAEVELLGAVFNQLGVETVDCCQLTNDGPVSAEPTNARSLPVLPAALTPAGMVLQQRFSVVLRPDQVYSLTTSSVAGDQFGSYEWVVLSTTGEHLDLRYVTGGEVPSDTTHTFVSFDLLTQQLSGIFGNVDGAEQFGTPALDSLCADFRFALRDDSLRTCERAQITRVFDLFVADTVLTEVCEQQIDFRPLGIRDISWPEQMLRFGCQDTFPRLADDHPSPVFTGYPYAYVAGVPVALTEGPHGNLFVSFEDVEIIRPEDGGTTVVRTWTVQDICFERIVTYVQTFKLDNNGLPFFTCPVSNHYCPIVEQDIMLWTVDFDRCLADIEIPQPELNNICDSANWTFITEVLLLETSGDTSVFLRLEMDDERLIQDVPPGEYLLHFSGQHPTETIADQFCRIRVADFSDPVMVCKANTNVSLPGSGMIRVPIRVVNQFSYDNCGIDTLQIRRFRQDSTGWEAWNETGLIFDCADVGFVWTVEVRGVDGNGNDNYCTGTITVRDNTEPYCTGLATQYITCDELPTNADLTDTTQLRLLFGMPEVIDNCSAVAIEFPPLVEGEACAPERVRRRFQAVDQHGNLSTGFFVQDIYVTPTHNYALRFPMDATTDCVDFSDTLRVVGGGCDSVTVRVLDIFLPTEGEECRYVQRNFVVTNWCEWDGVSAPVQISRDENCSGAEGDADVWLIRNDEGVFIDTDETYDNNLPAAGSACGGDNPAGYLRRLDAVTTGRYAYSQRFKVFDTTAPLLQLTMLDTICVDTALCRAPITVGLDLTDACQIGESDILVGVDFNNNGRVEATSETLGELAGTFPNYTFTASLPIGQHRYVITVTDDCGNTTTAEQIFFVNDCYVPVLTCRNDRIYNLEALLEEGDIDGDGVVEEAAVLVEANDLARCDFLDCSGDLTYSVNRVGEPYDRNMSSIYLDCEDRYEVYLEVYVWDAAFSDFIVQPDGTIGGPNWRMCVVRVRLQDPNLVCNSCQVDDNLTINGRVNSLSGTPLEDVTVSTAAAASVTNRFGGFQLGGMVGGSYELRAAKATDPRAGLSTIDLVILQRHLLGIAPITNPFVRLSADVNRDGIISLGDLVALQALVLARRELYPAGSPWRFVAADWDGTGVPPEVITLTDMNACGFDHDFIGLRLGDLNDSYGAAAGAAGGGRSHTSARPLSLDATDRPLTAGEEFTVELRVSELAALSGGQFALRWDANAVTYLGQNSEVLSTNANTRAGMDHLWVSWNDKFDAGKLLSIRFRAKVQGKASEYITLAVEQALASEVYDRDLTAHPLFLTWKTPETSDVEEINISAAATDDGTGNRSLGVVPNPARTYANVGVFLTSGQRVEINVTDLSGHRLMSRTQELVAGEQWLKIAVERFPAGIYLYTLRTDSELLSGRIIRQ